MIPYVFPPTLTVDTIHKSAQVVAPIIVTMSNVRDYTDAELVTRALLAADETRDRLQHTSVTRDAFDDRATVSLHRD